MAIAAPDQIEWVPTSSLAMPSRVSPIAPTTYAEGVDDLDRFYISHSSVGDVGGDLGI